MYNSFAEPPGPPPSPPGQPPREDPGLGGAENLERPEPGEPALRLAEFVSGALEHLEHNFIFRKLGITYDYASPPKDFPRSTLPNAREAREGIPNAAGIGTGMADCTANSALLLDGYLTRLELGIARPEEDRIMDRLVAGLIRVGTAGPRSQFVRGLTPDGRGFYPATSRVDLIHYAHALYRACHSPTLRVESQAKLQDICGKWLGRIAKNDFTITGLTPEESRLYPRLPGQDNPEAPDAHEDAHEWERLLTLLHLAAVTFDLQGGQEWKELYDRLSSGPEGPWLKPNLPEALTDSARLLALQVALADVCALDRSGPQAEVMSVLRRKIAYRAARSLANYQNFTLKEPPGIAALDWRSDLQPADGPEEKLRGQVYSAWPGVKLEAETVRESARSLLAIMLSGDEVLIQDKLPAAAEFMRAVPWKQLWLASSISPLPLAHALGQEKGLWDPRTESQLGEIPFGKSYGIEFPEGYEPLPADGPRPRGWEHKPVAVPKIVIALEEKTRRQNRPRPNPPAAKPRNGRGKNSPNTAAAQKSPATETTEPADGRQGGKERSRQSGKRRGRGRRSRRRSSPVPNGRNQRKKNKPGNATP